MLLFHSSGGPHPLITPCHRICPRVSAQVKSPSTCTGFGFHRILMISHTYQHIMPRTDMDRFNPICGSHGPVKQAFQPASRTDTVNEIAMVVVVLTSPCWRVTVPFGTMFCHGDVRVTVRQTYEGIAARTQPRSFVN